MTTKEWNLLCIIAENFLDGMKVKNTKLKIIGTVEGVYRNGTVVISTPNIVHASDISDIEIVK